MPSERQLADIKNKKKILAYDKKLRGIYGYRRVQVWLEFTYNLHLDHKRIQRLMNELGIKAVIRKKDICNFS
ncbi:transposase [Bacillus sp. (in: firmicutes)]|uniref:transposase n=1 Tax=Bacillus sp. TaxID=1409 RepID=UPI0039E2EA02